MASSLPDWNKLKFSLTPTDFFYASRCRMGKKAVWDKGSFLPWGEIPMSPAAGVLSYGLGAFEGLKAERSASGAITLFRPDANAERMERSSAILRLASLPKGRFVDVCKELVRKNERFVPPAGKGQFYLRPILIGSEPMLGLRKAQQFDFLAYGSPVGNYFAGKDGGVRLKVVEAARVAAGGTGAAKALANYPGGIGHRETWQERGFDDVLFLDARGAGLVTETSGSNFFAVLKGGRVVTPALCDQILPGITRASVIHLAREEFGMKVEERELLIEEVLSRAVEVFCTGTAWTVRAVASLTRGDSETVFKQRTVSDQLLARLRGIQSGSQKDPYGWTVPV